MAPDDRFNILLVDNRPGRFMNYEAMVGELRQNLIKAGSASQALEILLRTDIAVVLIDVNRGDPGCLELVDTIRQHPRYERIAILLVSDGHLGDEYKISGYRRGASDCVSPPVTADVLRAKIQIFVDLHRKTRQLEALNRDLERRVAERTEDLRQSEDEFRTRAELLELASEAIIVRDLDDRVLFWNAGAESLYGWLREEICGKSMHRVLRTIFPVPRNEVEAALRNEKWWQGNLTQHTKDGAEIVVACRKIMNRERTAVLEVGRDITAQVCAETALLEAEKLAAMGRVAGIIAHEINNPLAAITNLFYLLRTHPSLDDEARGLADLAEEQLERVSHITRQTLSFYRESKQPIIVRMPELLNDVLAIEARALKKNRVEVRRRFRGALTVVGYPVELRQVFLNLITNAVQAMQNGGVLGVRVREMTERLTGQCGSAISIIDTGAGIREEDIERIFQPFFSTKSTKGTGLGLWISKGIVQKYNGRISFRSYRHAGMCATCFRVFLPRAAEALEEGGEHPDTGKSEASIQQDQSRHFA